MIDNSLNRLKAKLALADLLMAILMGCKSIHRVIEVNGLEIIKTYHTIEILKNAIKIAYDIVAAIPDMASIKANTKRKICAVDD